MTIATATKQGYKSVLTHPETVYVCYVDGIALFISIGNFRYFTESYLNNRSLEVATGNKIRRYVSDDGNCSSRIM